MSTHVFKRLSAAAFQTPKRRSTVTLAWQGHFPFAFWSIERWCPRVFVELGTHLGDSYFAFCQSVQEYKTGTECFAVDTWQGDTQAGAYGDEIYAEVAAHNQENYAAFSHLLRMTFDQALGQFADGCVDLLHIDGFHTYEAVRHDFETWLPKMSKHGVMLFHDSNVDANDFGVWRLVSELDSRFPHFHFLHSYGLSMFTMTEDAPEEARWMTELSPSEIEDWRLVFSRLGASAVHQTAPSQNSGLLSRTANTLRKKLGRTATH